MSKHFHSLRIKEVNRETPDCVSICFDVPENLKNEFRFREGQHLSVRAFINGEELRRSYSICSAPYENTLRIAIKKVENGLFSTWANNVLKPGDQLELMPPSGKFHAQTESSQKKNYLAIAAGSGITPILSILKTTLNREPDSQFTLIYGNKNRGSIIFFEELEALKNQFMQRLSVHYILSRERSDTTLNYGRIDASKLHALNTLVQFASIDECFLCGPQELIFTAKEVLKEFQIPERNIHFELFNSTGATTKKAPEAHATQTENKASVTITLDGRSMEFNMAQNGPTILDAAQAQGADLPYACKGGMCCTCKAKLLEGEVSMDVHWGLEEEEVQNGYILTCQSRPLTDKISINFDL